MFVSMNSKLGRVAVRDMAHHTIPSKCTVHSQPLATGSFVLQKPNVPQFWCCAACTLIPPLQAAARMCSSIWKPTAALPSQRTSGLRLRSVKWNARTWPAKKAALTPACFAGDGWRPKTGLFSQPPRSSSWRVVMASAVLLAASRAVPTMNTLRSCFGLGASGLSCARANEQNSKPTRATA